VRDTVQHARMHEALMRLPAHMTRLDGVLRTCGLGLVG
jgi:hypothetical protein